MIVFSNPIVNVLWLSKNVFWFLSYLSLTLGNILCFSFIAELSDA